MKNAIILCSGGIDSVVTAHYVKKKLKYDKILLIFFDYEQRALKQEEKCSKKCAQEIGAKFIKIKLRWLGDISTSLINKRKRIRKIKNLKNTEKESKKWYVPCRNTIFLVHALSLAESLYIKERKTYDIFVGFKCEGKESYPDTTKKFVDEMNKVSKISCIKKFKIIAPLINKDKEDIILLGKKLKVDFENTFSCYIGKKEHCGYCLACRLRQAGFYWANLKDTTKYESK